MDRGMDQCSLSPATPTPVQEGVHCADLVQYRCTWMCAGKYPGRYRKHRLGIRWLLMNPDYNRQEVILLTLMHLIHLSA